MFRKIAMQFKKPSGFWGKISSNMMIKGNRPAYDVLLNDLNIQSGDKILEIGYGPGVGIGLIAEKFGSCSLYGIDFSELMFKRAAKRNKQFIEDNKVKLFYGDFIETDINTKDFDKIFFLNVVYFWDDLHKPFKKVHSLLKDGGVLFFYMASKDDLVKIKFAQTDIFNKYSIEQITDALKSAGFSKVDHNFKKGYYIKAMK